MVEVLRDLQAAIGQVPPREHAAEAKPLQEELQRIHDGHRRGPQLLGDILPIVLARLGVGAVQSTESGEETSAAPGWRAENDFRRQGANSAQSMELFRNNIAY